jgi:hypothetical protein
MEKVPVRARSGPPVRGREVQRAERYVGIVEEASSRLAASSKWLADGARVDGQLICNEHCAGSNPVVGSKTFDRCGVAEARLGERLAVNQLFAGSNPVGHPGAVER